MASTSYSYICRASWPPRTSVIMEVCKSFVGPAVGYAQILERQVLDWFPQLNVPVTASIDEIADAAYQAAQQIGGSTVYVRIEEGGQGTIRTMVP